ncbi:MAG: NAD(P)/FAD-dependent oxidoreductase [Chloroflexota bacterium]|nr:MAG: NAD(P)/FAD-dependent oxidoreductase [Chloroflexota bacterium]
MPELDSTTQGSRPKHVMVGSGPAGLRAIQAIRGIDSRAAITLVSEDPGAAYSKMLLPYLISGDMPEDLLFTRRPKHFEQMGVQTILGAKVDGVDTQAQVVRVNGLKVPYDKLLIATGARPLRPQVRGIDQEGVLTMWTLDDATRIRAKAAQAKDVLIYGAGLVAFQAIKCLEGNGRRLTLLLRGDQILRRIVDPEGGLFLEENVLSKGDIRIIKGSNIQEISVAADGRKQVILQNGQALTADLIIVATGAEPNLDAVKGSGIATDRGILVDAAMRTNVPNVYAAGDVAESQDFLTGERTVHGIWPTAVEQGKVAGTNMAGGTLAFDGGVSRNVLDVQGISVASMGVSRAQENHEEFTLKEPRSKVYRRIVLQDNRIVGAVLIGKTDDCGLLLSLMRQQVNVQKWKNSLARNPLDLGKIMASVR